MSNALHIQSDSLPDEAGPMSAHLFSLEREAALAEKEAVEARQRALELRQKVEKAKQLLKELGFPLPNIPKTEIPTPKAFTGKGVKRPTDAPTWTSEILKHVRVRGSISYPDLKDLISIGPLAERISRTDKGFYGAMLKLQDRGLLVRHNDHAFTPDAFKKYQNEVKNGDRQEVVPKSRNRRGSITEGILEYLDGRPEGARGVDIINHLELSNPNSGYNALNRMEKRDELIKDEDNKLYRLPKYRLVQPKTATSEVSPSREGELPLNETSQGIG